LKGAEREGVLPSGFYAGELTDLAGKEGGRLQRAAQYREWQPRLATYISALKRGMSESEAAKWSLDHHVDYLDRTTFERTVMRRVIPFYMWFARNTRIQAWKMITRPGKFATISKVLDTAARAAGFQSYEQYAGSMKDYKQRGLPFPLKIGGRVYDLQVGPPSTDLNQLTANPAALAQDVANRITFYKVLFELPLNYSVFFQDKIQPAGRGKRTKAPGWMADAINALPGPLRDEAVKLTGLQKIVDKHGGMTWGWYKKTDYALRSVPFGGLVVGTTLGGQGSRSQSPQQQLLGWATGVKSTEHTTDNTKLSDLGQKLVGLQNHLGDLADAGKRITKDGYATPEYQRTLDQIKQVTAQRDALRKKLGIVTPPRLKKRPLSVQEQIQEKLDRVAKGSSPEAIQEQIQKKLDRIHGVG
jgi:hypothetical protein